MPQSPLPALSYTDWEQTHATLQRILQIIGKIAWESSPPDPRWWFVAQKVSLQGYTSGPLSVDETPFEVGFNVHNMSVVLITETEVVQLPISVPVNLPRLREKLWNALEDRGLTNDAIEKRFEEEREADNEESASLPFDVNNVNDHWRIMKWVDDVLREFAAPFTGIASPVHFFWHHMDIAYSRYVTSNDGVETEITAGFWAGDDDIREPMFYAYTNPDPPMIENRALMPSRAHWKVENGFPMAYLSLKDVLESNSPRSALLGFLSSAYGAGIAACDLD